MVNRFVITYSSSLLLLVTREGCVSRLWHFLGIVTYDLFTQSINSRLALSPIPRDSIKYFEISVPRHIRFVELRKTIILTTTFNKYICISTLEVRDY